ncbi:MAG: teichuronic acid biosynthesis glycosyltransferase TuaC [Candidatus Binatota bacterium]|nr:teichuronic acid biosynthesis glycosyltransferase TuaC [Candidatus Binatota bacterium]
MRVLVLGVKNYPAFSRPWVHSGGMEVYAERMVRSLAGRARFTVYTADGDPDEAATVVRLGARRGLRTQPLSLAVRSWRRLRADGPVYDVCNPQSPLAAVSAWVAKRRWGIPYVVTVHVFGADPAHAGNRLSAAVYARIQALVFSEAAGIIPTGRRLAEALERRYPKIGSRITVVTAAGTGVRRAAEARATIRFRLGTPAETPVLLFLGRLVRENGICELLEAFQRLREDAPDARLWIAGSGDREARIRKRIGSLGIGGSVQMLGARRGQDKLDLLAAADVMVRTSRHEVFPEAYLEALSVGTPVAATAAGDTEDLATDSGAVAVLPANDPHRQAAMIGALIADRDRLTLMKQRALQYSRRVVWDDRKEVYWRVLESAAHGAAS